MTIDYGTDIWGTTDILPTIGGVGPADIMPQVICHRLLCDPATLLSAPDEQTVNLTSFLSAGIPRDDRGLKAIKSQIAGALLADPRILAVNIDLTYDDNSEVLTVKVNGTGSQGPFRLTLAVDSISVSVLNQ